MERITGITLSGLEPDPTKDPAEPGQVYDMLFPSTRIVTQVGPTQEEIDRGIASWGDAFNMNGFTIRIFRDAVTGWGEIGRAGAEGVGVIKVWVHVYDSENDPIDRPKHVLEGVIAIDPEWNRIVNRVRNMERFHTEPGMGTTTLNASQWLNGIAHGIPGLITTSDPELAFGIPGVTVHRRNATFLVHDA